MITRNVFLLITLLVVAAILGCSGGATIPEPAEVHQASSATSHQIWGLWQFSVDPDNRVLELTPVRIGAMHLNAIRFLEPPPSSNLTVEYSKFSGDTVTADIGLRHPFLGLTQFTGFDVSGIFITNGNITGFDDPDIRMAGEGDTYLLNPDGFTRWWNPAEFPIDTGDMFCYIDGLLGTPDSVGQYNCTVNAYKYYADGLEATDDIAKLDPTGRGVFSAGQKNVRRYIIKMGAGLIFNYAVDASWRFPTGNPPWHVPDDFPPDANRPEAWRISVTELENTLWNDGSDSGGELKLSIDVYDHFGADLNIVKIESHGNFASAASSTPVTGGVGYSTYEIDITDATPAEGSIDMFITVECDKSGYGGLLPGKAQAAYFFYTAEVSANSPINGIFVDGDNKGDPAQDGTKAHPYDDIMKGVMAAGIAPYEGIYDVYVDPYDNGVTEYPYFKFYQKAYVHGYSWNGGPGKPLINANSNYLQAYNVNDCLIDNLEYHIELPLNSDNHQCIQFSGANNFTAKNCKFTGYARGRTSYLLYFTGCQNLTLQHNEFVGLRNRYIVVGDPGDTPWPGIVLYVVYLENCSGYVIKQNEFHDFGYDDEGDATTYAWTITYMLSMFDCHDSVFANNLIYDYNDFSKADPLGDPLQYTKNHAHLVYWGSTYPNNTKNFTFANNTFDDLSVTGGDPSVNAQGSATYGIRQDAGWTFKNSICSNWHDLTVVPQVNWHRGFWADGPGDYVQCNYSCCYNYGTPGPGVTVNGFTNMMQKGIGSYDLGDNQDPAYNMATGPNWYHVTNPLLKSDDGTEMGAFGGPDGDWTPPSQE